MLKTGLELSKAGMKAIVFKDHYTMTSDRAVVIQECLEMLAGQGEEPDFTPARIYGGITLNYSVGGLNPEAVRKALEGDFAERTKCIWMPSFDAAWHRACSNKQGGINILGPGGKPKPEVHDILEIVATAGTHVAVSTSHLSMEESLVLAEAGEKTGVPIIATHATQEMTSVTFDDAREMVARGAWIELAQCSMMGTPVIGAGWGLNFNYSLRLIREIGPSRILLVTDAGQPFHEPVLAARNLIAVLMAHGVSESDINTMAKQNPAMVFGIE
jgi:hypothetical protein